ncbi:hypothetical protein CCACVL1_07652 [Corchorus capsularis]|uniref:Uncharacterized protein n=1 Tax=Corchorus capsularis TaxID=210143 RepID=A0A1R3J4M3_COCAP|nr:hypothetical protein CCACVL1_07652 [Corchorus capsularis]
MADGRNRNAKSKANRGCGGNEGGRYD